MMLTRAFASAYDLNFLYSGNVGRNLPVADVSNLIVSVLTNPDPTQAAIVRRQFDVERGGSCSNPSGNCNSDRARVVALTTG
jgi:hypothetical protein